MVEARKVSMKWLVVAAVGGIAVGAAGRSAAGRSSSCATAPAAAGSKQGCCHGQNEAQAVKCPAHYGDNGLEIDDQKETDRLRHALLDGIFVPWTEMGRAPTPGEFAQRMRLAQPEADGLLDQLQACGESIGGGILRVPESELIAVAWPLANVPTGITVTTQGGKPAFARCAIDALGVSEMLQKQTVVEASARDNGAPLRVVVDRDKVVDAKPAGIVVVKGKGCDNMSFFSSAEAAEAWQKAHSGEGKLFTLAEAVQRGAKTFGRYTAGL
jgi:Alkylmercury lyase